MTPAKEKAQELVKKFAKKSNNLRQRTDWNYDKQCALIAVDEILNNFGSSVEDKTHYCSYSTIQYYQEVKQEIELL